jgi:hypothetical protein
VTELFPAFDNGSSTFFIVDFLQAQRKGLEEALGAETAAKSLRGCKVHWWRNVLKIADRLFKRVVTPESLLFQKIAKLVTTVKEEKEVILLFEILGGLKNRQPSSLSELWTISVSKNFTEEELNLNVDWSEARHFALWWTRIEHRRMFTRACSLMKKEDWEVMEDSTNACESMNKLSHAFVKYKTVPGLLEGLFKVDFAAVAMHCGKQMKYPLQTARKKKARVKFYFSFDQLDLEDDSGSSFDEEEEYVVEPDSAETAKTIIGRHVMIDTKDENGKYGWRVAKIASWNKSEYKALYVDWKGYFCDFSSVKQRDVQLLNEDYKPVSTVTAKKSGGGG